MQRIINKEQWNKSGIYKITNLINKNFYIGSTKNIGSRYRTHVYTLKNNKSNCTILQNAINKYGINNFLFECIEISENYKEKEIEVLNQLNPKYNCIIETKARREIPKETRDKMSLAKKGIPSPFKGTKNPNKKKKKKNIVIYDDIEYTIEELAKLMNCSVQNIYQKIKRNKLQLKD